MELDDIKFFYFSDDLTEYKIKRILEFPLSNGKTAFLRVSLKKLPTMVVEQIPITSRGGIVMSSGRHYWEPLEIRIEYALSNSSENELAEVLNWIKNPEFGIGGSAPDVIRKTVKIILMDPTGAVVECYRLYDAWVSSYVYEGDYGEDSSELDSEIVIQFPRSSIEF